MSGLVIERTWPYLCAAIAVLVWMRWLDHPFPENAGGLIGATGTVSAVLVGFLVTSKSIILGLTGSAVFKALLNAGYHKILFAYIFEAELSGLVLLVVSICGFFVVNAAGTTPLTYQFVWVSTSVLAVCLFGRFLYMLHALLKRVD